MISSWRAGAYLAVASGRGLKGGQLGSGGQPGVQRGRHHAQARLALARLARLLLQQRDCVLALLLPCGIVGLGECRSL